MTTPELQHEAHEHTKSRWPDWIGHAAAGWAAVYALAALIWTVTGDGFPFGTNDPDNEVALLHGLPAETGAPALAGLMVATTVAALVMVGGQPVHRAVRGVVLGTGWAVSAILLIVVPTASVLSLVGYAPTLILGAPFGVWDRIDTSQVFTWSLYNQVLALVGGFLIAGATLAWQRRTRGACVHCGRTDPPAHLTSAESAARWGRWAVAVAVIIPLAYAVDRLAWLLGIPLLIDGQTLDEFHENGPFGPERGWARSPWPARSSRSAWCSGGVRCIRDGCLVCGAGLSRSSWPSSPRPSSLC